MKPDQRYITLTPIRYSQFTWDQAFFFSAPFRTWGNKKNLISGQDYGSNPQCTFHMIATDLPRYTYKIPLYGSFRQLITSIWPFFASFIELFLSWKGKEHHHFQKIRKFRSPCWTFTELFEFPTYRPCSRGSIDLNSINHLQ